MSNHPILMNGAMVRATLAGNKTQTRRIVGGCAIKQTGVLIVLTGPDTESIQYDPASDEWYCDGGKWHKRCPYGNPGDRLWVRETWAVDKYYDGRPKNQCGPIPEVAVECRALPDAVVVMPGRQHRSIQDRGRWRSSAVMPRWASRINLTVVSVRIERLQDISEQDAQAEGAMDWWNALTPSEQMAKYNGGCGPIAAFQMLWESINGPGSWEQNPHVWAVEFKKESEVGE